MALNLLSLLIGGTSYITGEKHCSEAIDFLASTNTLKRLNGGDMYALEKCWEIQQCARKEKCPAFPHYGRSCWLIKGKLRFLSNKKDIPACHRTCEPCEVYQWNMALLKRKSDDSRRSRLFMGKALDSSSYREMSCMVCLYGWI